MLLWSKIVLCQLMRMLARTKKASTKLDYVFIDFYHGIFYINHIWIFHSTISSTRKRTKHAKN